MMNYAAATGAEQLFAFGGVKMYDVTPENGTPVEVLTGLTNARWQYTQLTNIFGEFLVMVNGADKPQKFDGTVWTDCAFTVAVTETYVLDYKNLIHVHLVHRRLWFTEKDTGNAWYLPVDQIEGELTRFGAGELFSRGGFLQCVESWTVDAAAGSDDHVVFISSEGDIAVYTGIDPDVATDFTLDGVYKIGATIGRRCSTKYGSDLLILCEDGLLPMTSILAQSKLLDPVPLTDIIQLKLSEDVGDFSHLFGWTPVVHSRANQLYINVPDSRAYRQYVMNTVTGAWCEFNNYNGASWTIHNDEIFFGMSDGTVAHGWYGVLDAYDFTDERGGAIQGTALGAFAYLGKGAQQKHITMARATMQAPVKPQMILTVNVDFNTEDDSPAIPPASITVQPALWDQALWDQSLWGAASRIFKDWHGVGEIGFCAAVFLKVSTGHGVIWIGTDLLVEEGTGIL